MAHRRPVESVALRRALLPPPDGRRADFAGSALDPSWTELVRPPALITAQGLLMYLDRDDVHALMAMCAAAFPGGSLIFDSVPPWLARLVSRGTAGYKPPPLRWSLTPAELAGLRHVDPAIVDVVEVDVPATRGVLGRVLPAWRRVPLLRRYRPVIIRLDFAA